MPKVPTQEDFSVQPQQLPGTMQQTPRHLYDMAELGPGAQVKLGQQLQQAGERFSDMASTERVALVKDQLAQLTQAHIGITQDPTNGYMNQMGKAAVDSRSGTIETLQNIQQALEDQLPDDNTKAMFRRAAQAQTNAAVVQVDEHAARQLREYEKQAAQSRMQAASSAATGAFDPAKDSPTVDYSTNSAYQLNLRSVAAEANDLADHLGMPREGEGADVRAHFVKGEVGKVYAGTVLHLIGTNQTQAASGYLQAVKNQLDPQVADELQHRVDSAKSVDFMYQYTDRLFAVHQDEASQRKQVVDDFNAGVLNGEQRKIVEARVSQFASEQKQQQSEMAANVLGNVADFAEKGGKSILAFAKLHPDQYALLQKTGHLETAINYFNGAGADKTGDPALYNSLLDMAVSDPRSLMDYPVDKMMAQLSPAQFDRVMAARRGIKKQDVQQLETDKLVTNTVRNIKGYLANAGVNLNPKTNDEEQNLELFMANLRQTLYDRVRNNNGLPITEKEANDVAMATLKDQTIPGTGIRGFFEGYGLPPEHKRAYQLTDKDKGAAQPPDAKQTAYVEGKIYVDRNGNKAIFQNGKFVEVK